MKAPNREPLTITADEFDEALSRLNPINALWERAREHFYGPRSQPLRQAELERREAPDG